MELLIFWNYASHVLWFDRRTSLTAAFEIDAILSKDKDSDSTT